MLLGKAGTYIAVPVKWTVKSEEGKCPQFACEFSVIQNVDGEQSENDHRITGWFTLINKNGQPNTRSLESLRDALGWDMQSFTSLANGDWSNTEVQIVCEVNEYQGQTNLKVQWLNPRDHQGVLGAADPQAVQSLEAKYGSALRAISKASGSTKPAPAKASPAKPAATPAAVAKKSAWDLFVSKSPTLERDRQISVFKQLIAAMFEPRTAQDLKEEDWVLLAQRIELDYDPAIGGFIPLTDEIPF